MQNFRFTKVQNIFAFTLKAEVEIIIRKKSWQRKVARVKLTAKTLASETVVKMRNETKLFETAEKELAKRNIFT